MSAQSTLKRFGRAIRLDYARSAVEAMIRLRDFSARFGIEPIYSPRRCVDSPMPVDVVIPVVDKDADTLPFVVDSIREYLRHPVKEIFFVCPGESVAVRRMASERGCVAVDERELVPVSPKDIRYSWQGRDRGGWVYQQLLKWSGGSFCSQRHYLVADSDTVLARPQAFESEGKTIFDFCDEFHTPYFRAFERIVGIRPRSTLSFTSHHALIDTAVVAQLESEIEARHGMPWYQAIIEAIDPTEMSCVSDYENYGQYFLERKPQEMLVRYWYNKSLPRKQIEDLDALKRKFGRMYSTLSFHAYK